jgi:hypothetical protein
VVDADSGGEREVFVGLDELKGVIEIWRIWYLLETIPEKIDLAHVLYSSLSLKHIIRDGNTSRT